MEKKKLYFSEKQKERGHSCIGELLDGTEVEYTEMGADDHAERFPDSIYLGVGTWKRSNGTENDYQLSSRYRF